MHLPRLEKAKELEASAWLFSSSCAETLALSVFDEVFLFSVSLEYIPSRCPQGELRVATGTTHWHCARLSVRSMTRGILGIHYSNKQKRNYTMQLSTVSLFAVPQLLACFVWEGAGKVKLFICSLVIHSLKYIHWVPLKTDMSFSVGGHWSVTEQPTALNRWIQTIVHLMSLFAHSLSRSVHVAWHCCKHYIMQYDTCYVCERISY